MKLKLISKSLGLTTCLLFSSYTFASFNVNSVVGTYESKSTQNPVVLVHGLFGAEKIKIFGVITVFEYWGSTLAVLAAQNTPAIAVTISPFNSNEFRGEELIKNLQYIKTFYYNDKTKFNLVGHSQGGPTSRYVAGTTPELVSSIATIGSPHRGSPSADTVLADFNKSGKLDISETVGGSTVQSLINFAQNLFTGRIFSSFDKIVDGRFNENDIKIFNEVTAYLLYASDKDARRFPDEAERRKQTGYMNILAAIRANSSTKADDFNNKDNYPEGVPTSLCKDPTSSDIADYNTVGTPDIYTIKGTDNNNYKIYMTSWTGKIDNFDTKLFPNQQANDGTVAVCSARLGNLKGIYNWPHIEQMGTYDQYITKTAWFGLQKWQEPTKWASMPNPIDVLKAHITTLKTLENKEG
ncbi:MULTISPECIES: esterase/lipase family protein [Acinetobacter]|uniref:esterase/lipase family protein n=1 Tax=Acinetobacter TaxID=469 RepID=UPI00141AE0F4|nr:MULTISPECIES: alpha/beta fold hydrolase [Acinetobacter]MCS4299149.1 pimeloyl-ACP methyl ester carboxylesterase [Acinetobacter guillouiae]MCW2250204.1 triacylglycerol esterase/lipase EstA (alpha/beta hydrolase family) [Acinetobacter sp. BIGb0204]NII39307.1 pimeloyl-ACP methyl ester carboxylesterase [Acinetobacter sp. BIGb0196]